MHFTQKGTFINTFILNVWFFVKLRAQNSPYVVTQVTSGNFTESPFWDDVHEVLLYVDMKDYTVNRFHPNSKQIDFITVGQRPSFILPIRDVDNQFILTSGKDLVVLNWDPRYQGFTQCLIVSVDTNCQGNNWSGGNADGYGRIWAGTLGPLNSQAETPPGRASFYRVDTLRAGKARADVAVAFLSLVHGPNFTPDNRYVYFTDSPSRVVTGFHYDLITGTISNPRCVFNFDDYNIAGRVGGLALDQAGNLYIAVVEGSQVLQVNPFTGELLQNITIPVDDVSNVVFGGRDLDILYVTTKGPPSSSDPLAGSVFQVTGLGVTGTYSNFAVISSDCTPVYFQTGAQ